MNRLDVDLVLRDLKMPGVGGIAFIPYLDTFKPLLSVIVVTAYTPHKESILSRGNNR